MDERDMNRKRYDGYFEGSSGRKFQNWDGYSHERGGHQMYGDDARWKNDVRAQHISNDYFGQGNDDRTWSKNIDNRAPQTNHSGKGPKGYTRAKERIYEDACEALSRHPAVDASEIEVSVQDSIVTLTGTVESRRMKRKAEDIVEGVMGVEDVVNMLSLAGEAKGSQIDTSGSPLGPQ